MTDEVHDKQAILQRNRADAARMQSALDRLNNEALLAPNAVGDWSLRDVLSHIANPWFPEQMQSYLDGRAPDALTANGTLEPPGPEFDLTTQDGRNAWRHHVWAGESLEQVRARYERWVAWMEELIEALPDEDFERSFALRFTDAVGLVRPAEEGEPGYPLWRWLQGETWHHLEEHVTAFEEAAGQQR